MPNVMGALIVRNQLASNTLTIASRVSADTTDRYIINTDGMNQWGPGNAALDTNLYRGAANQLRTDDMILQNYAGGAGILDQNAALNMSISGAPTAPINGIYGVLSTITIQPANTTVTYAHGIFSQASYAGTGTSTVSTINSVYARTMIAGVSPVGTVTSATAVFADSPQTQATGSPAVNITNQYGIYVNNQSAVVAGTTTANAYGLYLASQTGIANAWAIYSAGGKSAHAGSISIGATTAPTFTLDVTGTSRISSRLQLGTTTAQATTPAPLLAAVLPGNGIEFGHSNTTGYRSMLGAFNNSGRPFIAFSCAHGTGNNTFITQGLQGSVFASDLAGGFTWFNIPVATAGTDNQVPVTIATLSSAGVLTLPSSGINVNGNVTITGSAALIARSMTAATDLTFVSRIPADTQDRFQQSTNGTHYWGSGTAATDVALSRPSAGLLYLNPGRFQIVDPGAVNLDALTISQSGNANGIRITYTTATTGHGMIIVATNPTASFAIFQLSQADTGAGGSGTYQISAQKGGGAIFAVDGNGVVYSTQGSISVLSAAELKEQIEPLPDALSTIMALKPRRWKWKSHPQNAGRVGKIGQGLVAEDAEQVLPHIVGEWNTKQSEDSIGGKLKTVAYGELVPYLLGAVQELTHRLEALESKVV